MTTTNSNDRPKAVATDCAPTRKYDHQTTSDGPRFLTGPIGDRDPFEFLLDEFRARGVAVLFVIDEDELDDEEAKR